MSRAAKPAPSPVDASEPPSIAVVRELAAIYELIFQQHATQVIELARTAGTVLRLLEREVVDAAADALESGVITEAEADVEHASPGPAATAATATTPELRDAAPPAHADAPGGVAGLVDAAVAQAAALLAQNAVAAQQALNTLQQAALSQAIKSLYGVDTAVTTEAVVALLTAKPASDHRPSSHSGATSA